jgi:hypothetical protein
VPGEADPAGRAHDPGEQPLCGVGFGEADQVEVGPAAQQAGGLAGSDPHGQQDGVVAGGVLGEGGLPLRGGERGLQVGGREHQQGPAGLLDGLVHALDEHLAGAEVPGLQHGGVAGALQGVGDPLGPGGVGAGVADEEVALLVLVVHPARPAPYGLT